MCNKKKDKQEGENISRARKERIKCGGGGLAACGLVDVEEGVTGERGESSGAAERLLGGLLEVLVDVVRLDVRSPCLLPLPRPLRRLPHPFFLSPKSLCAPKKPFFARERWSLEREEEGN